MQAGAKASKKPSMFLLLNASIDRRIRALFFSLDMKRLLYNGSPSFGVIDENGLLMIFHEQDRSGAVTLSEAKGLSRWAQRCFASLSMTLPVVGVKVHNRR